MSYFELTNRQREYFGLSLVANSWDKEKLDEDVFVYFDQNKIVKILNYKFGHSEKGYFEYDTDINTVDGKILLPQTSRGRELKLTVSRLLKIKGCGVQFTATFVGGGIHVYDHKRNVFFIKSYFEEGLFKSYEDINTWIEKYIIESPADYLQWLKAELAKKRIVQKVRGGDVIAFKVSRFEYGFARVLFPVFGSDNIWIHPRSLTIAPYAFISSDLSVDIDKLILKKTLPSIYIFDNEVYYGQMPIVGFRTKTGIDDNIPLPVEDSTYLTIYYTKTDILKFIDEN